MSNCAFASATEYEFQADLTAWVKAQSNFKRVGFWHDDSFTKKTINPLELPALLTMPAASCLAHSFILLLSRSPALPLSIQPGLMNARDLNHCTPHGDSDGGGRKEGAVAGGPAGADARRGRRESGGAASVVVAIVLSVGRILC